MTVLTTQHLRRALEAAFADSSSLSNAIRSDRWVVCLAEEIRTICAGENIAVFTRKDQRNRKNFGTNELLYDISVCETSTIASPGTGKKLHHIAKPIWQIESEFREGDSSHWVRDFNKLVLGSAVNKLFVGPNMKPKSRDSLLPIAKCCSGTVYIANIPHPSKWTKLPMDVSLWRREQHQWMFI